LIGDVVGNMYFAEHAKSVDIFRNVKMLYNSSGRFLFFYPKRILGRNAEDVPIEFVEGILSAVLTNFNEKV